MYVYLYVYMYIYMYIFTYLYLYVFILLSVFVHSDKLVDVEELEEEHIIELDKKDPGYKKQLKEVKAMATISELSSDSDFTSGYNSFQLEEKLKKARSKGVMGLYAFLNDLKDKGIDDKELMQRVRV